MTICIIILIFLMQIVILSVGSIVFLFLFVVVEKNAPFPLIDFMLLKDKILLSANIINMTITHAKLMWATKLIGTRVAPALHELDENYMAVV